MLQSISKLDVPPTSEMSTEEQAFSEDFRYQPAKWSKTKTVRLLYKGKNTGLTLQHSEGKSICEIIKCKAQLYWWPLG